MTGFSYNILNDLGPNSTASAGGLFLVDNIYPGTLSLGGLLQGTPDVFFIYELAPAEPLWLTIEPNSGTVGPGNTGLIDVYFDAFEFPVGTTKTATIHLMSEPNIGNISIPVTMTIGSFEFGYIEGNVILDGILPYNIGDVTDVVVEAGPYTAFPDLNGDFLLETYPGTFDVVVSLYGYETQTISNITVVEGTTVSGINFTMPCVYGIISGVITEADGGAPVPGATITLIDTEFNTVTASDGTYNFIVEAGTYDVKVVKGGFSAQTAMGVAIGAQSTVVQNFQLEVPERKICVIDLDPTPTGEGLVPIVENFFQEGTVHYTTSISGYPLTDEVETLFLLLGVYPNNYTLTNADAAFVASWIESYPDRNIYMEGGETWAFDDPTLLHAYFKISGLDDGSSNLVNINGLSSFWAGKSWVYTGENNWIDQIEAIPPAINIMENPNAGYYTSVAYDEGTYKTIGSSHEIMGLTGGAGTGLGVAYVMAWFGYPVFTPGSLEGYVTEDQTGDPVEGATINIAGLASGTSGPNGYYLIEDALLGTWDATATKQNFHPQTTSVTIVEGATANQDFVLEAPGTLQGVVTESNSGNPVANAMINIGNGMYTTMSGVDGTYVIEEILTGTYDVIASKENFHPQNVSLTIASTLVVTQNFMLEAPGSLEGTVTESGSGVAVTDAIINVGEGMYTTMTGSDGTYLIEEILTGTYNITCTKYGYTPGSASVTITESTIFIQDFELLIPQIVVNPMAVEVTMDPMELLDSAVNISNPGNGSVDWNGTVNMASDKSKNAWDLQFTFDLEAATGGPGNGGAECDGQYYYTTRWASDLIHKFDFDGNLIEEFSIPGVYGLRNLAF
ncbi:MAG: carboxypeptidase-like regulatory domain-containing protein [Bacteroidales bacterium]